MVYFELYDQIKLSIFGLISKSKSIRQEINFLVNLTSEKNRFFFLFNFSTKIYVVDTQMNSLIETVLLRLKLMDKNICTSFRSIFFIRVYAL